MNEEVAETSELADEYIGIQQDYELDDELGFNMEAILDEIRHRYNGKKMMQMIYIAGRTSVLDEMTDRTNKMGRYEWRDDYE